MPKLDKIISEVNGDLQDCLAPVRDRFRQAMSNIFDYAVSNPAQGNAATAQSAIATAFKVHYADGLVSPGITIEQAVAAFNNRHGVGATANAKWVSVRDFIVARSMFSQTILNWLEEGQEITLGELWHRKLSGFDPDRLITPSTDTVFTETRNGQGFLIEQRWSSVLLGKTVRVEITMDANNNSNYASPEII